MKVKNGGKSWEIIKKQLEEKIEGEKGKKTGAGLLPKIVHFVRGIPIYF